MAQPAAPFVPRDLSRSVPFSTPRVSIGAVPGGNGVGFGFDVGLALSDRNQLGYSTPQLGFTTVATGFFLDVALFSDQASTLDVLFTSTITSVARSVMVGAVPLVVAANTPTFVAGLRIIGSFVTVNFVNTAVGAANVELWAAVRSG